MAINPVLKKRPHCFQVSSYNSAFLSKLEMPFCVNSQGAYNLKAQVYKFWYDK